MTPAGLNSSTSWTPSRGYRDQVSQKVVLFLALVCAGFQYLKHFIMSVSGKMNLMVWGKRCWFAHPESTFPLANVMHVVLSTTLKATPDHAHFVRKDFESAICLASQPPLADLFETIWIVGGTQVYKEGLEHPWCDLLYLTDIMAEFDLLISSNQYPQHLNLLMLNCSTCTSLNHTFPKSVISLVLDMIEQFPWVYMPCSLLNYLYLMSGYFSHTEFEY
uniref:dihydrofolate reductase n=1 Tax=Mola mola TaxID=94237 RepID=A0A3Q3XFQ6_MOLML